FQGRSKEIMDITLQKLSALKINKRLNV
ncbi:MAG: hypothetical protein JWR09_600, partial [Mucilaginibacter sp.]|nr:hypothetical protein [Mucilaginibacter sp.]